MQESDPEEDKEWIQVPSAEAIRAAQQEEERRSLAARAAEVRAKMVECPICNQVMVEINQQLTLGPNPMNG